MVELQKIKGENHFFSTAANQTLHTGMIIPKIHHTNTKKNMFAYVRDKENVQISTDRTNS